MPGVFLSLIILIVAAIIMWFIAKVVPIVPELVNIVLLIFLFGKYLTIGGVDTVDQFIADLPYLNYVLGFVVGSAIGGAVSKYLF